MRKTTREQHSQIQAEIARRNNRPMLTPEWAITRAKTAIYYTELGRWSDINESETEQYEEVANELFPIEEPVAETSEQAVEIVVEVVEPTTQEVVEMISRMNEVATVITTTTRPRQRVAMNLQLFASNPTDGVRANRVAISTDETTNELIATFYKTHDIVGRITQSDIKYKVSDKMNKTATREDFRNKAIKKSSEYGIKWQPELQEQAWDRKYWKYETDQMVEEDAIELMKWTIQGICSKLGMESQITSITLDSIVPNQSNLSYVDNGKYIKNGNWASAIVNLEVTMMVEGNETEIIYPIEMVSGQLKKIKLDKATVAGMVEDGMVA